MQAYIEEGIIMSQARVNGLKTLYEEMVGYVVDCVCHTNMDIDEVRQAFVFEYGDVDDTVFNAAWSEGLDQALN